jgi:hypothetical protein
MLTYTKVIFVWTMGAGHYFSAYGTGTQGSGYVAQTVNALHNYYLTIDVSGEQPEPDPEPNND